MGLGQLDEVEYKRDGCPLVLDVRSEADVGPVVGGGPGIGSEANRAVVLLVTTETLGECFA
jgi:hypothetical protein